MNWQAGAPLLSCTTTNNNMDRCYSIGILIISVCTPTPNNLSCVCVCAHIAMLVPYSFTIDFQLHFKFFFVGKIKCLCVCVYDAVKQSFTRMNRRFISGGKCIFSTCVRVCLSALMPIMFSFQMMPAFITVR